VAPAGFPSVLFILNGTTGAELRRTVLSAADDVYSDVAVSDSPGRAVQVDPMKPVLKAPGTMLLQLRCDEPVPHFAFKVSLRRYTPASTRCLWGVTRGANR